MNAAELLYILSEVDRKFEQRITYGEEDLEAGVSALEDGYIYIVYE